MKLTGLLEQNQLHLSFEVFPPKTSTLFEDVKQATEQIAALRPSYISVTYGAGGGTSEYTLKIAENLLKTMHVPTLAHLTCVSSTPRTIRERIRAMQNAGIENVLALRGDLTPELASADRNRLDYRYAVDLIREL